MKRKVCILQLLFISGFIFAQGRTLEAIFPGTDPAVLKAARNGEYSHPVKLNSGEAFKVKPVKEIDSLFNVKQTSPLYTIESLLVLKKNRPVTKLDIYNALHRISALKGRQYFSSTRSKTTVMFEDASIIASDRNLKKQNDPPPALSMPRSKTIFITVDDVNFGNCYYKAEINTDGIGIKFLLTNFRNVNYMLIPAIKTGNLQIELYIESLDEGVLIYGLTGVTVSSIADNNVDIPSAITKRLDVIYAWIGDSISNR